MFTPNTRNVTRAFRNSTEQQRREGRVWYRVANQLATMLDDEDPRRGAGVLAALSPATSWDRNVQCAQNAYAGKPIGNLGDNVRKVHRILSGEDPANVLRPTPRNQKVANFFRLIADPSDPYSVCVDRHAYDIAVGRVTDDKTRLGYLSRVGGYESVAKCYRSAARIISAETGERWTPAEIQAVTWVYWRQTHSHFRRANSLAA